MQYNIKHFLQLIPLQFPISPSIPTNNYPSICFPNIKSLIKKLDLTIFIRYVSSTNCTSVEFQ